MTESKSELLNRLIEGDGQLDFTKTVMSQMMFQMCNDIDPRLATKGLEYVEKVMIPKLKEVAIQKYDEHYTEDEIRQMLAYAESPVGKKAREKTPVIFQELQVWQMQMGADFGGQMMEWLNEIDRQDMEAVGKSLLSGCGIPPVVQNDGPLQ